MKASKETQNRDISSAEEIQQARFGHDPQDQSRFHRGEVLDAFWEQEFDRRLAAWEAESPTSVAINAATAELTAVPR